MAFILTLPTFYSDNKYQSYHVSVDQTSFRLFLADCQPKRRQTKGSTIDDFHDSSMRQIVTFKRQGVDLRVRAVIPIVFLVFFSLIWCQNRLIRTTNAKVVMPPMV